MPSFDYIFTFVRTFSNVIGLTLEFGFTQVKPTILRIVREDKPFNR